jgi:hypothetical protein
MAFMQTDMNENDASIKAEFEISKEYHIPLLDIKKVVGSEIHSNWTGLEEKTRPRKRPRN